MPGLPAPQARHSPAAPITLAAVELIYSTPGPEQAETLLLHVAISFDGYRAFAPQGWEPPDELTPENVALMRRQLADPAAFALMAVFEEDPIGHVLWVPAQGCLLLGDGPLLEDLAHLRHLFVLEPWWGSGVAKTLHDAAVAAMAGRPARLYTPARQARARRFYEREGWWPHGAPAFSEMFGLEIIEYRRAIGRSASPG